MMVAHDTITVDFQETAQGVHVDAPQLWIRCRGVTSRR
ncbi:Hypothetical protein A7982_01022 [Minicystis rosea]|nr:Hypothetical protein A7982_01022 [Minicystis rosea]